MYSTPISAYINNEDFHALISIHRSVDSLGGGNLLRSVDSLGGGHMLMRGLGSLGGGHVLRQLDSLGGGNILRGVDAPAAARMQYKRGFDPMRCSTDVYSP